MTDAYSRTWVDYEDDLDAQSLNDLEARMEARAVAGGGGGGTSDLGYVVVTDPALNAEDSALPLVGNGTTDDLPAWNALIGLLNAHNFGTAQAVFFPPGTYIFDGNPVEITTSNLYIFGSGPATILKKKTTSNTGNFFKLGLADASAPVSFARISNFQLVCNQTTNYPPASDNAVHLLDGGHLVVDNLLVQNVGGLIKVGSGTSVDARVQRYEVHDIMGTFNCNTPNPDRISVLNGTNGTYTDIEVIGSNPGFANDLSGGTGILCAPPNYGADSVNNDEHKFTNVHFQGGMTSWFEADVTHGDCFNWVFKHCTMDGAEGNTAYIHNSSGTGTVTDMHFLDCHVTTRSGIGLHLFHNGSVDWRSIQWKGGRIKYLNNSAVVVNGTDTDNIHGLEIEGASFLHDHGVIVSSDNTANVITNSNSAAEPGHYLSVGDPIIFAAGSGSPGTLPGGITAGSTYYVHTIPTVSTFTLGTVVGGGGSTKDLTGADWTGTASYMIEVDAAVLITGTDSTRVMNNYFGPYYGQSLTQTKWAVQGASTPTQYSVQMNTARGMTTAFSVNLPDVAGNESTAQNRNNVTDT